MTSWFLARYLAKVSDIEHPTMNKKNGITKSAIETWFHGECPGAHGRGGGGGGGGGSGRSEWVGFCGRGEST